MMTGFLSMVRMIHQKLKFPETLIKGNKYNF
jgi:hypothetical protein